MGRPKDNSEKRRLTVLLSVENDEFLRSYAEERAINISTAANIILSAILKGNLEALREASLEHNTRRQF